MQYNNPPKPQDYETLQAIERFMQTNYHAPTVRELADRMGLSHSNKAYLRLQKLIGLGWLDWDGRARTMKVTKKGLAVLKEA